MLIEQCFCLNLQKTIIVLAGIDAILSIFMSIFYGVGFGLVVQNHPKLVIPGAVSRTEFVVVTGVNSICAIFKIFIAMFLYVSAREERRKCCRVWLWLNIIFAIIGIATITLELRGANRSPFLALLFPYLVCNLLEMYTVYCFTALLDKHGGHLHYPIEDRFRKPSTPGAPTESSVTSRIQSGTIFEE